MRVHFVLVASLAGAGCFPLAPLADCADRSGLYVAHHVCMPLAGPPLVLDGGPVALVVGDFDDRGTRDDLAVLLAPDVVQVYTGLELGDPVATWQGSLRPDGGEVEGLVDVRWFDAGAYGEDLIAWTIDTSAGASGQLIGLRNGGDMFASALDGPAPLTVPAEQGKPRTCPLPNSVVGLAGPAAVYAETLAVTCSVPDSQAADPLDVVVISNDPALPLAAQARRGASETQVDVHAAVAVRFDAEALPKLLVAHRPAGDDHDRLALLTVDSAATPSLELEPRQGFIDQIAVADLDDDDDLDIVTLHADERGVSVILQQAPLQFAEPEFYSPHEIVTRVVIGDFTGDGGADLAVAHLIDNARQHAITMFVRKPDMRPGEAEYQPVLVGRVDGSIVDLAILDFDGDARDDIAVTIRDGTKGSVAIHLNRSPGDVGGG